MKSNRRILILMFGALLLGVAIAQLPDVHGQERPATEVGRYQAVMSMRGDRLGGTLLVLDTTTGEGKLWSTLEGEPGTMLVDHGIISFSSGELKITSKDTVKDP